MTDKTVTDSALADAWKASKRDKYPGELREPIHIDMKLWGPTEDGNGKIKRLVTRSHRQYRDRIEAIVQIKWDLLCALYGIPQDQPDTWELLARALVAQHVPGFQRTSTEPANRVGAARRSSETLPASSTRLKQSTGCAAILPQRKGARFLKSELRRRAGRR